VKGLGWIVEQGLYPGRAHKGHEATLAHRTEEEIAQEKKPLLSNKSINVFLNARELSEDPFFNEKFVDPTEAAKNSNVNGATVHQTNDSMTFPNIQRTAEVSPVILFEYKNMNPAIEEKIDAFYGTFVDAIVTASSPVEELGDIKDVLSRTQKETIETSSPITKPFNAHRRNAVRTAEEEKLFISEFRLAAEDIQDMLKEISQEDLRGLIMTHAVKHTSIRLLSDKRDFYQVAAMVSEMKFPETNDSLSDAMKDKVNRFIEAEARAGLMSFGVDITELRKEGESSIMQEVFKYELARWISEEILNEIADEAEFLELRKENDKLDAGDGLSVREEVFDLMIDMDKLNETEKRVFRIIFNHYQTMRKSEDVPEDMLEFLITQKEADDIKKGLS
ncbi:MAG: hypothetical protein KAR31_10095, partial [Candidatus Omnitrophica bacterium]|nr:hypothetical protein [Candidatus Omnitrophota bacterium]